MGRINRLVLTGFLLTLLGLAALAQPAASADDWMTALPREPIHVGLSAGRQEGCGLLRALCRSVGLWAGPEVAALIWPIAIRILSTKSFRQYAIDWGINRVGRLFNEEQLPLSIALNAQFPGQHKEVWEALRLLVSNAPVIAHGMNNSTELLPLGRGIEAQEVYIRRTLALTEKDTGVRPRGWSSPSVFPNADTFTATAAEGIRYSLDGMNWDVLSRLVTKSGPLILIPYPAVTVDMGQYLSRSKEPSDLERLWVDYVTELAREAEADPAREASVVAIGIHPFVVGTPAGTAALRRVLENFKQQKLVWVTDVEAILAAAGENP